MDSQLYLGDHDQTKYYEQTCLKQKTFIVKKEKIIVHENYVLTFEKRFGKKVGISHIGKFPIQNLKSDYIVNLGRKRHRSSGA